MVARLGRIAFGVVSGTAGAAVSWFAFRGFMRWVIALARGDELWSYVLLEVSSICLAVLGGLLARWYAFRALDRKPLLPQLPTPGPKRWRRTAWSALAAAYLLTWAWGIPSVITHLNQTSIAEEEARAARSTRKSTIHPRADVIVAIAPLPGFVVLYAETYGAGTCDWGGWAFYLWYPGTCKHLWTRWYWIT